MAKLFLNRQNSKIQLYAHKVTTYLPRYLEMSDVEIMFIFKNASHILFSWNLKNVCQSNTSRSIKQKWWELDC